jgi:hypothetical protein
MAALENPTAWPVALCFGEDSGKPRESNNVEVQPEDPTSSALESLSAFLNHRRASKNHHGKVATLARRSKATVSLGVAGSLVC